MDNLTETERRIINQVSNRQSERVAKMTCIDCGSEYEMTLGRICSTYNAGLIVPCRCPECKQKKDDKFKSYEVEEHLDK